MRQKIKGCVMNQLTTFFCSNIRDYAVLDSVHCRLLSVLSPFGILFGGFWSGFLVVRASVDEVLCQYRGEEDADGHLFWECLVFPPLVRLGEVSSLAWLASSLSGGPVRSQWAVSSDQVVKKYINAPLQQPGRHTLLEAFGREVSREKENKKAADKR